MDLLNLVEPQVLRNGKDVCDVHDFLFVFVFVLKFLFTHFFVPPDVEPRGHPALHASNQITNFLAEQLGTFVINGSEPKLKMQNEENVSKHCELA